jgi:hypothetical protein
VLRSAVWSLFLVGAALTFGSCSTAFAQDAKISAAPPAAISQVPQAIVTEAAVAAVKVVGSGVFAITQGEALYVEDQENSILIFFPNAKNTG